LNGAKKESFLISKDAKPTGGDGGGGGDPNAASKDKRVIRMFYATKPDLKDDYIRMAIQNNVKLVIDSDAHQHIHHYLMRMVQQTIA
jgi:hypothetical protein